MSEIELGAVCECKRKKLGVVLEIEVSPCQTDVLYKGIGFDGKPWQSKDPTWVAESLDHYLSHVTAGAWEEGQLNANTQLYASQVGSGNLELLCRWRDFRKRVETNHEPSKTPGR